MKDKWSLFYQRWWKRRKQKEAKGWRRWWIRVLGVGGGAILGLVVVYAGFWGWHRGRIYPGVKIGQMGVGGMRPEEAETMILRAWENYGRATFPHRFGYAKQVWWWERLDEIAEVDVEKSVLVAMSFGRGETGLKNLIDQGQGLIEGEEVELVVKINRLEIEERIASMAAVIEVAEERPRVAMNNRSGEVEVVPGKDGLRVKKAEWKEEMAEALVAMRSMDQAIPVEIKTTNKDQLAWAEAVGRGKRSLKQELTVGVDLPSEGTREWKLGGEELLNAIEVGGDYNQEELTHLLEPIAQAIDREPQEAQFMFDETNHKVKVFAPELPGLELNMELARENLRAKLKELEEKEVVEPLRLVLRITEPEVTLEEINNLGITELIGRGYSTYKGSIASRRFNVKLAAFRVSGTLVKPNETFSFNQAVGEISSQTGYQQAYIIRNGRTELGDGGGVCQDSTTVFRAALDAGLPIVERRAHAYRVGYYEQNAKAGLDATVFSPSTDLKFLNDTPGYLLIQTKVDETIPSLTVEIYGTSDGRKSEISNHRIWEITPPPPDVYIDDPNKPNGSIEQVEHKVAGAKAAFDYTVRREGEVIYEKTFYSIFKPWAAVFIRGTGP